MNMDLDWHLNLAAFCIGWIRILSFLLRQIWMGINNIVVIFLQLSVQFWGCRLLCVIV